MSSALWGFAGTIVGAIATFSATWLQQRRSAAREELAFARHAEERRRDAEASTIKEIREMTANAAVDLDQFLLYWSVGDKETSGEASDRWNANYLRVLGPTFSVGDEGVRLAVLEAYCKMVDVFSARDDAANLDEVKRESKSAVVDAQMKMGARLRELT